MRFTSSSKEDTTNAVPTTETSKPMSPIIEEKHETKSSSTPTPTKPTPARTPSTRFQEPTRAPSEAKRNPSSNMQRTTSTATTKTSTSTSTSNKKKPERPGLQRRRTTAQTRYIDMLLELDNVSKLHNVLASAFTWILLAGYIVFPATFNKLKTDRDLDEKADSRLKEQALKTARNIPLLYIAAFACGIGVFGCLWLWWAHRRNYVWVINRIFLPALMNSIAGLISTLVNIYSAQDGQYSVTARATIVVTSVCSVVTAALFMLYNTVMLAWVKHKHQKETKALDREKESQSRAEGERSSREDDTGAVV